MTDDFTKNKILFVPGKNPNPLPDAHRALLWRCLLRGVERKVDLFLTFGSPIGTRYEFPGVPIIVRSMYFEPPDVS